MTFSGPDLQLALTDKLVHFAPIFKKYQGLLGEKSILKNFHYETRGSCQVLKLPYGKSGSALL